MNKVLQILLTLSAATSFNILAVEYKFTEKSMVEDPALFEREVDRFKTDMQTDINNAKKFSDEYTKKATALREEAQRLRDEGKEEEAIESEEQADLAEKNSKDFLDESKNLQGKLSDFIIKVDLDTYEKATKEEREKIAKDVEDSAKDAETTMEKVEKEIQAAASELGITPEKPDEEPIIPDIEIELTSTERWYQKGFIGRIINTLKNVFFPEEAGEPLRPVEKARNDYLSAKQQRDTLLNNIKDALVKQGYSEDIATKAALKQKAYIDFMENTFNPALKAYDSEINENLKPYIDVLNEASIELDTALKEQPQNKISLEVMRFDLEKLTNELNKTKALSPTERAIDAGYEAKEGTKNPFRILDIPTSASAADIKKAYFNKSRELHPDKATVKLRDSLTAGGYSSEAIDAIMEQESPKITEQFQELGRAYDKLKDDPASKDPAWRRDYEVWRVGDLAKTVNTLTADQELVEIQKTIDQMKKDIDDFSAASQKKVQDAESRIKAVLSALE